MKYNLCVPKSAREVPTGSRPIRCSWMRARDCSGCEPTARLGAGDRQGMHQQRISGDARAPRISLRIWGPCLSSLSWQSRRRASGLNSAGPITGTARGEPSRTCGCCQPEHLEADLAGHPPTARPPGPELAGSAGRATRNSCHSRFHRALPSLEFGTKPPCPLVLQTHLRFRLAPSCSGAVGR